MKEMTQTKTLFMKTNQEVVNRSFKEGKMRKKLITLLVLVFTLSSCASVQSLRRSYQEKPEKVKEVVFDAPYDRVIDAAREAAQIRKLKIVETASNEEELYMNRNFNWLLAVVVFKGIQVHGGKMAAYFTPIDADSTGMELVFQKNTPIDLLTFDEREPFIREIRKILANG